MSLSPKELVELYARRDQDIQQLATQTVIEVSDLEKLDRLGRYRVADELWQNCSEVARSALLHDEHAHVRSAAQLAD